MTLLEIRSCPRPDGTVRTDYLSLNDLLDESGNLLVMVGDGCGEVQGCVLDRESQLRLIQELKTFIEQNS